MHLYAMDMFQIYDEMQKTGKGKERKRENAEMDN